MAIAPEWALRIERRYESGGSVPLISRRWAEDVLGRQFVRAGRPGSRPDAHDRRAGDDSFDDEQSRYVRL